MEGGRGFDATTKAVKKEEYEADNFLPHAGLGLDDRGLNTILAIFCHRGRTLLSLIVNNLFLGKD